MNLEKNYLFVKTSSETKRVFDNPGLCVLRIGEYMSTGSEWISGMYGTKIGTRLPFEAQGIGCLRGFFVEPGPRVRWICKVGRVVQAINERI